MKYKKDVILIYGLLVLFLTVASCLDSKFFFCKKSYQYCRDLASLYFCSLWTVGCYHIRRCGSFYGSDDIFCHHYLCNPHES